MPFSTQMDPGMRTIRLLLTAEMGQQFLTPAIAPHATKAFTLRRVCASHALLVRSPPPLTLLFASHALLVRSPPPLALLFASSAPAATTAPLAPPHGRA